MNFSKKGTVKKQKQLKSTPKRLFKKMSVSFFRTLLVFFVVVATVGVFCGMGVLKGIIDNAPSIDYINVAPTGFSTTIYDQSGKAIDKLVGSNANRIYRTIDKIPLHVQNAFIAIEDERFYEHNGIDVRGIFRAFFSGLAKGEFDQGASTITQQLLKNQVFDGGDEDDIISKFKRKLQEQYLAIQLEDKLSKTQILEYYLNAINLGQSTLGIQAASLRYFNKGVEKLTLSEATVIAGTTKNPVYLNPINYPEENAKRRTYILDKMKKLGQITESEYNTALEDDVYTRIQSVNEEIGGNSVFSYFTDETIEQVMDDLQSLKGYSQDEAINAIYRGGLKIYTTQDSKIQKKCDKILQDNSLYPPESKWELNYRLSILEKDGTTENYSSGHLKNYFLQQNPKFTLLFSKQKDADKYIEEFRNSKLKKGSSIAGEKISFTVQPQISFVIMDQKTGQVKAIVGGRGTKEGDRTLNRASSTVRQPGSTFKILSTYLPALDTAGMTLATAMDDAPYAYPNGTPVNNWNRSSYKGLTTLREGIVNSMNIVTVKTLDKVTPKIAYDYLLKLGFTTIVDSRTGEDGSVHSDINLPMALGGLTDGVTNLELTAAFAAVANNGVYTEPSFYTKIVDHNGKVLLQKKPEKRQVMKESTAWLLTNAMEDVVKRGTGTRARLTTVNMPVSGKTGTTTNDNDLWFAGFTPYYTATIWSGYDNNGKVMDTNFHKTLWRTIMENLHENKKTKSFIMPSSITTARICTKSGKLAVDGVCDKAQGGSAARIEYFANGTAPKEKCDVHVKLSVCTTSKKLSSEFCPSDTVKEEIYIVKKSPDKTKGDLGGTTLDTPYLLPKSLEDSICNVHSSLPIILPPEKEEPKEPPITLPKPIPPVTPEDELPVPPPDSGEVDSDLPLE